MSTIYMIRHGQASFGQSNYDKLSKKGIKQSKILANHLMSNNIFFDMIYSGTMARHLETEKEYIDCLKERGIGIPERIRLENLNEYESEKIMTTLIPIMLKKKPDLKEQVDNMFTNKRAFQILFDEIMMAWVSGAYDDTAGLPSWSGYKSKVIKGLKEIIVQHGSGRRIGVFTSGGPISVSVQHTLNLSDKMAMSLQWQVVNSSLTRFKCTNDRIMLSTFNEHSHLEGESPEKMITYR